MAFENKQYLDYSGLKTYDAKIKEWIRSLNSASAADLQASIDNLEALVGEGTVDERVAAAVASIIDAAPETFDTLKEVAQWIEEHGEAAAALVQQVGELENKADRIDRKVDDCYDAIQAISSINIEALFLDPVTLGEGQTVQDAVNALQEGQKLVLTEDVAENLTINSDAVIEAEGVDFSGKITVDENAAVTIIGATFSGEVVVQ